MGVPLLVLGLAGAGVQAAGQMEAGQAKSEADSYKAQVAANNAVIAQNNARFDIQAGETAATNQGLKTRAQVGMQKATQGGAGIDVNTGSASQVRAGTEEVGMLDALTLRSNSAKKAYGDQVEATNFTAQSQLDTMASKQDAEAGEIGGLGTLLSGASTVGGNYMRFQGQFG